MPGTAEREVIGFVTGRLAEPSLRRVLDHVSRETADDAPAREFVVLPLRIDVAALMTSDWVARHLKLPRQIDRLVLPGWVRGELEALEESVGAPVERGPRDLRDLPAWLGGVGPDESYGEFAIEILAEINHVPQLRLEEILALARAYRDNGADIIDLGCDPDGPFEGIGDVVRALREEGLRVSIDSLDAREIVPAVAAGAELVLSVTASNVDVVDAIDCEVVLIPDSGPRGFETGFETRQVVRSLEELIKRADRRGLPYRLDPILEPIGFGFAASLGRYIETRRAFPEAPMLMGIGNLTELTDGDSASMNTLLLGFCAELSIDSVLTTEVINWAASSVRECDLARRLVHHACTHRVLPKHLEPRLHLLRAQRLARHGAETLATWARDIRDSNVRVFAEDGDVHLMSRDGHVQGPDPFELFDRLDIDDASHAFYLGYETAKAVTALTLGKNYVQDEALDWGFLTRPEKSHLERHDSLPKDEG